MICRLIAPVWLLAKNAKLKDVIEGDLTTKDIQKYNKLGYNCYYLPNYPSNYDDTRIILGRDIDVFEWVFVDYDLKSKKYESVEDFVEAVGTSGIQPTKMVLSGNGIHAYWRVTNLDTKSYLRFQRRLMRLFNTDPAVGQIFQLMRIPGTKNTKIETDFKKCTLYYEEPDNQYTAEQLDDLLPPLTLEDEQYCNQHFDKTYGVNQPEISPKFPLKWGKLLQDNQEVHSLFTGTHSDRSKADYRLAHLLFAHGFTKDEALSVLVNCPKAMERAPIHRASYALNIADQIWTFELEADKTKLNLSKSVKDILMGIGDKDIRGERFPCNSLIDNTEYGFRIGHVLGLVAGSGVGKTSFTLNMFRWFASNNPTFHHFFVPLEQPDYEIASRWAKMCGSDTSLHEKVHILSNYDDNSNFRRLSLDEIQAYLMKFQEQTGHRIGCVVIDHIGALRKKIKDGENQGITEICHAMKAFAVQTKTFLVMQSQTNREKAGIGDEELDKNAAYGTMYFEAYCDFLVTLWQPLKRCHADPACPTATAYKFAKIRHKNADLDKIKEDKIYHLYFNPKNECMEKLTQDQKISFKFFASKASAIKQRDKNKIIAEFAEVPDGDNEA